MRKYAILGAIVALATIALYPPLPLTTKQKPLPTQAQIQNTPPEKPVEQASQKETYRVVRVVDGDTIVVDIKGTDEKIRLIGVNTPESVDPRRPVQCFGKEASAFTKALLENQSVRIEPDTTQGDRDKYGRLLRYVFTENGELVNQKIIAEGYGHEYTYRTPYQHQADFKQAEQTARASKKGLWADGACNTPNAK